MILGLVILASIAVRLSLGALGYNFDFESYVIVDQIMSQGKNVYAATWRYNYGPAWFYVVHFLGALSRLFSDSWSAFLVALSLLLALTDAAIAGVLFKRYGTLAAVLFLFSPISIVISGFHRQFDNLALLLGLVAVIILDRGASDKWDSWLLGGVTALALSLTLKHDLFAFPLWLAMREQLWKRRLAILLAPPVLFLGSFLPFWREGHRGIIEQVFLYKGVADAPLWHSVLGDRLGATPGATILFATALIIAGWLSRHGDRLRSLLIYTVVLVAFSPSLAPQYLAIPVAAASVFFNPAFAAYSAVATIHLALHPRELGPFLAPAAVNRLPDLFPLEVWLLVGGLAWTVLAERNSRRPLPPVPAGHHVGSGRGESPDEDAPR